MGALCLPDRAIMKMSRDELKEKLIVLRQNKGDFQRESLNREKVWKGATNHYIVLNLRSSIVSSKQISKEILRSSDRQGLVSDSTAVKVGISKSTCASASKEILTASVKRSPTAQVVPRLREFSSVEDVVHAWRTGRVVSNGKLKRVVTPLFNLVSAQKRMREFETESTVYSNRWWEQNHKSAFLRIKKVVENVASFEQMDTLETRDNLWLSALLKYKEYNKGLISKGKPSPKE